MTAEKKKNSKKKIIPIVLVVLLVLLTIYIIRYFTTYHAAEDVVNTYFDKTTDGISVSYIDNGIFIDSPATDKAVIYYPGCKVEYTSYIPFCYELAKTGVDVFILKVKLNFALFDKAAGQQILDNYNYQEWILMGHSMGGIAISSFAEQIGDKASGLVLLGAHGTSDLTNTNIKTLVMYGSEDGVVQRKKVEAGRTLLAKPENYYEFEIPGANHANWAHYGSQAMDKEATISRDEQIRIGIEEITKIFNN